MKTIGDWSILTSKMAMMKEKLAIIGAGEMGSALVRGFIQAGLIKPDAITASDRRQDALNLIKKETGVKVTFDNTLAVKSADIVLLALKPDLVQHVLREIKPSLTKDHLIISIAAGIAIRLIEAELGRGYRVIRVMPNTPCLVGSGASAFSAGKGASRKDREVVSALLESVGTVLELPEKQLDAVTGLSGSGPAFVFMVIEALADGGVKMGLSHSVALKLATQTVLGAARLVQLTHKHPRELKDQVASPGGTTIAGLAALEKGQLSSILIEAVEAATRRSIELGSKGHESL